jgi:Cu(I)/Ag(I) efflux system membrane protein CusA/SilA
MSFLIMYPFGVNANIMSLGGIAIAIGVMVDASIVMVENAHKHLERDKGRLFHTQIIINAAKEVGPALFFSLLIITVSFLPVFTLMGQSGRMFRPLAYTKTTAMAASSVLAITIIPVLMTFFVKEHTIDPKLPRPRKKKMWIISLIAPPLAVVIAGIAGVHLPDSSLVLALLLSLFLGLCLIPQKIVPENKNILNRFLIRLYLPVINTVLKWRKTTVIVSLIAVAVTWYPMGHLGSEFMPPLNEGDLLYMPTTLPGISITKARELLQQTDKIIKRFPEVKSTYGKIGRAETSTDPAPLSMIETVITLHPQVEYEHIHKDRFFSSWPGWLKQPLTWIFPEQVKGEIVHQWRKKKIHRFFSGWPGLLKAPLALILPEERYITMKELTDDLEKAVKFPGLTNAWTMPIATRIDMLSTGIKTPVGIKIMGPDLSELAQIGEKIEGLLQNQKGTASVFSERVTGGNYLDFTIKRDEIARYGLLVEDVQDIIKTAIGGMNVTNTFEGLERYPVNLRYNRNFRDNIEQLKQVMVPTPSGTQVPIAQLADIRITKGPAGIKSENSKRSAWVFVDIKDMDIGTYVKQAKALVDSNIKLPAGYSMTWSGQYEYMQKAKKTLSIIIPATLLVIFILLYIHFGNIMEVIIVMASIPFALLGGFWLTYVLGYNLSVAVGVGFIALAGLATETGIVMLVYLDEVFKTRQADHKMNTLADLHEGIIEGAVDRVRPKIMTVATTLIGLLPVMWGTGTGSQIMKRIAAPMVGGLVSSTIMTLIIIPVIYNLWKHWELNNQHK